MTDDDSRDNPHPSEGRFARWSRLKRAVIADKPAKSEPPAAQTAARTPVLPAPTPEADEAERRKKIEDATKDLPPVESLGKDSDYSLFMREGVPEETRTAALRKLWRSDPTFTEPFPFEMHMEDYNKTFVPINAAADTLFRAGLGYVFDDEKDKKKPAQPGDIAADPAPVASAKTKESAESPAAAKGKLVHKDGAKDAPMPAGERRESASPIPEKSE